MNCTAHLPPVLSTSTTRRPWTIRWSARTGTALISNASYFRESSLLCVMNSLWRLMKNCLQRGRQGQERNEGLCHALVSYLISWTMIDYILAYWSIIPKLSVLASLGILFVILPQVDNWTWFAKVLIWEIYLCFSIHFFFWMMKHSKHLLHMKYILKLQYGFGTMACNSPNLWDLQGGEENLRPWEVSHSEL